MRQSKNICTPRWLAALAAPLLALSVLDADCETSNVVDAGAADAGSTLDAAGSDGTAGQDTVGSDASRPDITAAQPGEICETAHVLTWAGSTLTASGDTQSAVDDYVFAGCPGASWYYPNPDLVYRLDVPAGDYLVTLRHDLSYTFLSVLHIQTSAPCVGFADSCAGMDDSTIMHNVLRLPIVVEDDKVSYLAIDSALDPFQYGPGEISGPYRLTIEQVSPVGLGHTCGDWWDCLEGYSCFYVDDAQNSGYCTNLCSVVNCSDGAIPMQCRDISDYSIHWPAGSEACIASSEIGTLVENEPCYYSFTCEPLQCVTTINGDLDWGECRQPCTTTCTAADQTCVEITNDLYEVPAPPAQVKICAPSSEIGTVAQGGDCQYSYQCLDGLSCVLDTCRPS